MNSRSHVVEKAPFAIFCYTMVYYFLLSPQRLYCQPQVLGERVYWLWGYLDSVMGCWLSGGMGLIMLIAARSCLAVVRNQWSRWDHPIFFWACRAATNSTWSLVVMLQLKTYGLSQTVCGIFDACSQGNTERLRDVARDGFQKCWTHLLSIIVPCLLHPNFFYPSYSSIIQHGQISRTRSFTVDWCH